MDTSNVITTALAGITLVAAGGFAIIGLVEMVKALVPEEGQKRNWRTFWIILVSMIAGVALAPAMKIEWIYGFYVGLSAAGIVKVTKG